MKQLLSIILLGAGMLSAQGQTLEKRLKEWATDYTRTDANIKPSTVTSCTIDKEEKQVHIVLGGGFPEQHFIPEAVERAYAEVKDMLPNEQKGYDIIIEADGRPIEDLVPNYFRNGKKDHSRLLHEHYKGAPWVKNVSRPYTAPRGLEGRHISLWQSHGRYWKTDKNSWWWQRPRMFCTNEDLFSQTFVVPFIIPMLENAGAVVFTPRERDYQTHEVIVDNDHPHRNGIYVEALGKKHKNVKWKNSPRRGFAQLKEVYESCDSPFVDGTARSIPTTSSAKEEAVAQWVPDLPEDGRYAVYVTYQTLEGSVDDAHYTVFHKGGQTELRVNQQMGGGTWVYLGTFDFDAGESDHGMVVLSNRSERKGVVSADAVRFGGGMGNIVPEGHHGMVQPSGLPRWAEAAKYSIQWMGFPYRIHTEPFGDNDYNNDISSRSAAINYLSGGSIYNPNQTDGLHVPLDVNVAFHTDAGVKTDDALVGSLSIYMTDFNDGKTGAGLDRYVSRDLASMLLTNLTTDMKKYGWQVRQLWNRNYGEARVPLTPACILEMLSHQNFADMRLAYDPHFKFDLSRSVYKTIVKFLATEYQRDYTIQPLPVENFAISLDEGEQEARLTWDPVDDPLEPTARPHSYIVYMRRGYGGFDNGTLVHGTHHKVKLQPGEVYSFKITALNDGGESFPSEVLACGISPQNRGTVLVVNAFTRLEGPATINTATEAGFDLDADPGVPYGAYTGFCGRQTSFDRSKAGSEASDGLGASTGELEGQTMMGNTFDYVAIHGRAIMLQGRHSFTSCSEKALLTDRTRLADYPIADIIYGTQRRFESHTNALVEHYFARGGKVIVSAANPGGPSVGGTVAGQLTNSQTQELKNSKTQELTGCGLTFDIYRQMNPHSYSVPSPSVLTPPQKAIAIITYADGTFAATAQQHRFVRLGFPLESITDRKKMNSLMGAFLSFLE